MALPLLAEENRDAKKGGNRAPVTVVLVEEGRPSPSETFIFSMEPDGSLFDIDDHPVENSALKNLVRENDNNPTPIYLRLLLRSETETSLTILTKTLAKIKQVAEPNRETIIFVPLNVRPRVSIQIVERGDTFPKNCERIRLFPDGLLRDIDAHKVDDKTLLKILRSRGIDNPEKRLLIIKIDDEDETSVAKLKNLLNKIRACADPKRETKVYVYLEKHREQRELEKAKNRWGRSFCASPDSCQKPHS
jgi:hypothetical protein